MTITEKENRGVFFANCDSAICHKWHSTAYSHRIVREDVSMHRVWHSQIENPAAWAGILD